MSLYIRWRRNLEEFLDRHRGPAVLLGAVFLVGVIFGALAVRSLATSDMAEMVHYLDIHAPMLTSPPKGTEGLMLRRALLGHAKSLALIWVLGISVVGVLGVGLILFLRGFVTGFVVSFLAAQMGARGVVIAAASHFPQSLLEVPALLLAGMAATGFARQVFRAWRERRRLQNFYPALAAYTAILLGAGAMLAVASGVEAYLTPGLVKVALGLLQRN